MPQSKRVLFPLIVVFMLILQLMSPISVLADGETPPNPPATEEIPPPEEPIDTEEAPSTDEPATEDATLLEGGEATGEPAAEDTSLAENAELAETPSAEGIGTPEEPTGAEAPLASEPAEEPAPEAEVESPLQEADLTVAEVLEQAPAETEVVVINEEGQVEPLVTEEAAEIAANADPLWCPDGQAPTPGANGCTSSYTSLQDLLNYLNINEPAQAGTIWIQDSYDSSVNDPSASGFTIDGTALTNMSNYDLTIQGGWNGANGSTVITGTSTFSGDYLEVTNWDANVTLNDIVVHNTDRTGITVTTSGDIELHNVTSHNNDDDGAFLANDFGTGNITLTGTNAFNGNGDGIGDDNGIEIYSSGDVNLTGVAANQNDDDGIDVEIYDAGTLTITNSILGSNIATGNGDDGLDAETDGSVTLKNVVAIGNDDNGAYVDAGWGDGNLIVSNSTFSLNGDEGFEGYTYVGEINFTNVFANKNEQFGLWLEAGYDGVGDGDVTLNNVTANTNGLGGAVLQTEDGNINVFTGRFNGNGADATPYCEDGLCGYYPPDGGIGLAAGSWGGTGQINLENVQASNNYGDGAWLEGNDVVVRNSTFHNNGQGLAYPGGDDLWADGLYITDLGGSSAYLECVKANNNAAYGIEIYTSDITLNGITVSGNGWDNSYFESDTLSVLDNPCKSSKTLPDLPWQIVPITGGESIGLNCTTYAGTVLVLPNRDEIRLPCPTLGDANLTSVDDADLPDELPEENNFVSSFTAQVIKGGISLETLPASMIVSFVIPEEMLDADLAILYWDGAEWVEVAGAYKTADDRFEASVDFTGTFVLVRK